MRFTYRHKTLRPLALSVHVWFLGNSNAATSSNDLTTQFEYADDPGAVIIDMSRSHVWDASTVAALDAIVSKYENRGKTVTIQGLNDTAAAFHGRLTGNLGAGH